MGVQQPNSTSYQHTNEPNLLDLHNAMQYNTDGEPEIRITSSLSLTSAPWNLQVARGLVTGVTGLSISGYRQSSTTDFLPAWQDGAYVYFPTAQAVRVWSESASDTNVSVLITGLDANYVQQTETVVVTNGTTGVLSTSLFLRVNQIRITRTPQNVGIIHAGSSDKTITLAYVNPTSNGAVFGAGVSQMTVYTVPAGYTFYLTQSNWYINSNSPAAYRSWTRASNGVVNIILTFPILDSYNSLKVVPRPYAEKTDIQWQASVPQNTAIGGQIEGYLIQNGL